MKSIWLCLVVASYSLPASFANGLWPDPPSVVGCPDSLFTIQQYNDGNLDTLYKVWSEYFHNDDYWQGRDSLVCLSRGMQVLGALEIGLHQDTLAGYQRFRSAMTLARNAFIFKLGVPAKIQQVFDEANSDYGHRFNSDRQAWEYRWMPQIDRTMSTDRAIVELRKKYHECRIEYAIAEDGEYFFKILHEVQDESDPAFKLIGVTVMLRLAYAPGKIHELIQSVDIRASKVVSAELMAQWRGHLSEILRQNHPGFSPSEMKPKPKAILSEPATVKLKKAKD